MKLKFGFQDKVCLEGESEILVVRANLHGGWVRVLDSAGNERLILQRELRLAVEIK